MKKKGTVRKVLVVDDEPLIRYIILRYLSDKGLESKAVVTAEDALEAIKIQHYDFCFLDVCLPGMSGLEAMEKINEKSPSTKIVIMTANFLERSTIAQIENLAFTFIEKPFSLSTINDVVDGTFN